MFADGVGAAPAAGHAAQRQVTDPVGQVRGHDQPVRASAPGRASAQQQQRRAGRPRLRRARGRVERPAPRCARRGSRRTPPAAGSRSAWPPPAARPRAGWPPARRPYRARPAAMSAVSCGHTVPLWYSIGLYDRLALGQRADAPAGEQLVAAQVRDHAPRPARRRRSRSTAGGRCWTSGSRTGFLSPSRASA